MAKWPRVADDERGCFLLRQSGAAEALLYWYRPGMVLMAITLSADQVWQVINQELFAVLGMTTANSEARTVGVMYAVRDRKLYIVSGQDAWKVRHIAANPHVSITIPVAKRIPIMPWVKIPAATITFSGMARLVPAREASPDLLRAVLRQMADDQETLATSCLIEVTPEKDFVTYGIGVSLREMRDPERARGRAPVA